MDCRNVYKSSRIENLSYLKQTHHEHKLGRRCLRRSEQKETEEVVLFKSGVERGKEVATSSAIRTSMLSSFWLRIGRISLFRVLSSDVLLYKNRKRLVFWILNTIA